MPGIAPVFSLPGDRMFQAREVEPGFQRPAIMHAYGGAKTGMERALASIASEGWLPMAFEQTGDPLLLIGRDSSRRRQRNQQVVFLDMRSFQ